VTKCFFVYHTTFFALKEKKKQMSTDYEILKFEGTWNDRVRYVRSLSDKNQLEDYLKQSTTYDDVQMLIFLSKITKNEKNLLDIFKTDSYPIHQRIKAVKIWLQLQTNQQHIYDFVIDVINQKNLPRL